MMSYRKILALCKLKLLLINCIVLAVLGSTFYTVYFREDRMFLPRRNIASHSGSDNADHHRDNVVVSTHQNKIIGVKVTSTRFESQYSSGVNKSLYIREEKSTSSFMPTKFELVNETRCTPKKNIVFVKTHKCASSSVQNMLMRRAFEENLVLVLPLSAGNNYLSRVIPFRRQTVMHAPWASLGYNILCHHIRYNHAEVQSLMPKNSVFVTILREPVELFESLYSYVNFKTYYKMDIEEFSKNTHNFTNRLFGHLGKNQMLFDLGFPDRYFNDTDMVRKEIVKMENRFDLIMIAEYFDESMILLKDLLCWSFDDIVTFKLNSRKNSKRAKLSDQAKKKLHDWSMADTMVYDNFLKRFKQRIVRYGEERMKRDVKTLKDKRRDWFTHCIEGIYDSTKLSKKHKLYSNDVWGYQVKQNVHNVSCDLLAASELKLTSDLYYRQLLRSLPLELQNNLLYRRFVQGRGKLPSLSSLSFEDKTKVLNVARLLYPPRPRKPSTKKSNVKKPKSKSS